MAGFASPERVIAYIDGFNTYHGMRSKAWRRYLWLDYRTLLSRLLKESQQLVEVNYFTAIVNRPADSAARHKTYLRALRVTGGVEVHLGLYTEDDFRCLGCGTWSTTPAEKQTDVHMASRLILDGARDRYDTAFLMSGARDFVPAVRLAREELGRRVIVIQPPGRSSAKLVDVADAGLHFNRTAFAQSQLPDPVVTRKGKAIPRPDTWR